LETTNFFGIDLPILVISYEWNQKLIHGLL